MKHFRFMLVVASVAAFATGCTKKPMDTKSDAWQTYTAREGYSFDYPSTWSVETLAGTGILIMAPTIEAGSQANVFFELRSDAESRSIGQMLEDLIPNLKKEKAGFTLGSSTVVTHASGLAAGRINYTHNSDGTRLSDCETIIVLDEKKLLFVLTSTASSVTQKYNPVLARIVDSIKKR